MNLNLSKGALQCKEEEIYTMGIIISQVSFILSPQLKLDPEEDTASFRSKHIILASSWQPKSKDEI